MIQSLYGDADRLLGDQQAKNFGAAIETDLAKQLAAAGGLGSVLRLDPLADAMPPMGGRRSERPAASPASTG